MNSPLLLDLYMELFCSSVTNYRKLKNDHLAIIFTLGYKFVFTLIRQINYIAYSIQLINRCLLITVYVLCD